LVIGGWFLVFGFWFLVVGWWLVVGFGFGFGRVGLPTNRNQQQHRMLQCVGCNNLHQFNVDYIDIFKLVVVCCLRWFIAMSMK